MKFHMPRDKEIGQNYCYTKREDSIEKDDFGDTKLNPSSSLSTMNHNSAMHLTRFVMSKVTMDYKWCYLYCFVELEVENCEKTEREEAHHKEVGNQDVVSGKEIQIG